MGLGLALEDGYGELSQGLDQPGKGLLGEGIGRNSRHLYAPVLEELDIDLLIDRLSINRTALLTHNEG